MGELLTKCCFAGTFEGAEQFLDVGCPWSGMGWLQLADDPLKHFRQDSAELALVSVGVGQFFLFLKKGDEILFLHLFWIELIAILDGEGDVDAAVGECGETRLAFLGGCVQLTDLLFEEPQPIRS